MLVGIWFLITIFDHGICVSLRICIREVGILNTSLYCGIRYSYRIALWILVNPSLLIVLPSVSSLSQRTQTICYSDFVYLLVVGLAALQFITCTCYWWKPFFRFSFARGHPGNHFLLTVRAAIARKLSFMCYCYCYFKWLCGLSTSQDLT